MNTGDELEVRAVIATHRRASANPSMRAQGERDEQMLLDDTAALCEHPTLSNGELYSGPCQCAECLRS